MNPSGIKALLILKNGNIKTFTFPETYRGMVFPVPPPVNPMLWEHQEVQHEPSCKTIKFAMTAPPRSANDIAIFQEVGEA